MDFPIPPSFWYNNNNIFRHFKNITISALRVPSFNVTWIIWPSGSLADPLSNCPFTKWDHSQLQAGRGIEKVSQSASFAISSSYEWAHISFCFQHSNHPKSFGWFVLLIKKDTFVRWGLKLCVLLQFLEYNILWIHICIHSFIGICVFLYIARFAINESLKLPLLYPIKLSSLYSVDKWLPKLRPTMNTRRSRPLQV